MTSSNIQEYNDSQENEIRVLIVKKDINKNILICTHD